jgi:ubiquinone/menaquinone biosynthesis C-methylase UbiE
MWLARDMKQLGGEVGLDAGCGDMSNRRYFRTNRYIGVDADAARLQAAMDKIVDGNVEGVVARIEDLSEDYRADVVVCVQLAGAKFNDPAKIPLIVDRLIALTKPGGSLILTVTAKGSAGWIEQTMRNAFRRVTKRRVGEPSKYGIPKRVPIPISILLAYLMAGISPLRKSHRFYLLCLDKRA